MHTKSHPKRIRSSLEACQTVDPALPCLPTMAQSRTATGWVACGCVLPGVEGPDWGATGSHSGPCLFWLSLSLFSLRWILVPDITHLVLVSHSNSPPLTRTTGAGTQGVVHPCLGQRWCKDCRVRGRSGASPFLFWRHHFDKDTGSTAHRWVQGPMRRGPPWRSGDPEWPRRKPVE